MSFHFEYRLWVSLNEPAELLQASCGAFPKIGRVIVEQKVRRHQDRSGPATDPARSRQKFIQVAKPRWNTGLARDIAVARFIVSGSPKVFLVATRQLRPGTGDARLFINQLLPAIT